MLMRYVGWLGRKGSNWADGEVYADDELPATIYPKFERIYRGGVLAELQRRVPPPRHTYPHRNSELAEICLRF